MPSWTSSNTFPFFPLIIERKNAEKHQLLHLAPTSVTSRPIGSVVGWDVTGLFVKELLNHEMEFKFFFSNIFKLTQRASKCDILFWFVLFA